MTTLIIAEKPSVAADIAKALGGFSKNSDGVHVRDDIWISSALGHLCEVEVPEAATAPKGLAGLPILATDFSVTVKPKTSGTFNLLKKLMNDGTVHEVVNACDAGREGELIFGLIYERANCRKKTTRMWAQSMTQDALREAYINRRPGTETACLLAAARCRTEADWLVGINGSRGLSALHTHMTGAWVSMNAGRVQTPTLAIVVHLEREIQAFVSRDYWQIVGRFGVHAGEYTGRLKADDSSEAAGHDAAEGGKFFNRAQAEAVLASLAGQPVLSATDEVTASARKPPKLFDLTTLQREASKRFGLSVKKVLDIAQALYEKYKMTTYPRTDSSHLPEDYGPTASATVQALHNSTWGAHAQNVTANGWINTSNKAVFDNSKISDHFAIIPTGELRSDLTPDEAKVYDLIVRRFLAAFHPAAQVMTTTRTTIIVDQKFLTKGTVITSQGWLAVIKEVNESGEAAQEPNGLCVLGDGETPSVHGIDITQGKTTPPSRFTDGALLGAMETAGKDVEDEELREALKDKGLGTPATRAAIIEGLLNKGTPEKPRDPYLLHDKKFLVPAQKAFDLIDFLERNGAGFLTSASTTASWEEKLNRMAKGNYDRSAFMSEIRGITSQLVDLLKGQAEKVVIPSTPLNATCPKCKQGQLTAMPRSFGCSASCGLRLNREIAQRPMKDAEMEAIMNGQTVGPLDGFYSTKSKSNFSASLKMGDGKIDFVFDNTPKMLGCDCPKCGGPVHIRQPFAECPACAWKLWRNMAGRVYTDDELKVLLTKGKVGPLNGFVGKEGKKKFSASIVLKLADMSLSFEFANTGRGKR